MALRNSVKTGSGNRAWKNRPSSIRARLLIAFVLMSLLTAISISVSSVWVGYLNGSQQVQERLNSVAALKALAIRVWANDLQNGLLVALNDQMADARIGIVLDLARTHRYYGWYNEAVRWRLNELIQQSGQFEELCLVDTNGVAVLCTGSGRGAETCGDAPYFQQALAGPYVEFPFAHKEKTEVQSNRAEVSDEAARGCLSTSTALGSASVVVARPVIGAQGEVLGVIAGWSGAAALSSIVDDPTGMGGTGKAYLANSLLARFPPRANSAAADRDATVPSHSAGADAALRNLSEVSGIYRDYQGDLMFGVYRWLPDLQVLLAVEQSFSEAFSGVLLQLAVNLSIALLAVLLAVAASFLITRSITRPIVGLAETASQISAGNLDRTAEVQRDDEIGVLANAFNSMTSQLRDLIGHLEERVNERTQALRAANEALQRRAVQMETSAQVSREITSILRIDDLLARVVHLIQESFAYFDARIFLLEGEALVRRTSARAESRGVVRLGLTQVSLNTEAVRINEPVVVNDVTQDTRYLREDNLTNTRSELAIPLRVGERVIGTLDVVSDRPNAFAREDVLVIQSLGDQVAIAIANARLYERSRALAALEERNRLARDLHDSVNQSLYSLNLLFEGWRRFVRAGETEKVEEYFDRAAEISQQALAEMRLLLHQLRPTTIEQGGLVGALRRRLEAVERRAGVKARLLAEELPDLPAPVQDGLYRIAQEALNNVLKHAAASEVTVRLHTEGDQMVLRVSDDGRGFTLESVDARSGMGVSNMRQRAEELGGGLTIESETGKGTTVTAKVSAVAAIASGGVSQ